MLVNFFPPCQLALFPNCFEFYRCDRGKEGQRIFTETFSLHPPQSFLTHSQNFLTLRTCVCTAKPSVAAFELTVLVSVDHPDMPEACACSLYVLPQACSWGKQPVGQRYHPLIGHQLQSHLCTLHWLGLFHLWCNAPTERTTHNSWLFSLNVTKLI